MLLGHTARTHGATSTWGGGRAGHDNVDASITVAYGQMMVANALLNGLETEHEEGAINGVNDAVLGHHTVCDDVRSLSFGAVEVDMALAVMIFDDK